VLEHHGLGRVLELQAQGHLVERRLILGATLEFGTGRLLLDCAGSLGTQALLLDREDPFLVQARHDVGRRGASLDARVERVRQKSLNEVLV